MKCNIRFKIGEMEHNEEVEIKGNSAPTLMKGAHSHINEMNLKDNKNRILMSVKPLIPVFPKVWI